MASTSTLGSRLKFLGLLILGIALFALVLVVMGTRVDNQDVTPTPASPAEEERQDLAKMAAKVESSATSLGLTDLADDASGWVESLGGVWVPWPDGAPEGYTNPPVETSAVANEAELSALLGSFTTELLSAASPDPGLSSAMALSAVYHQSELTDAPACETPNLEALGKVAADGVSVERLETARQWLEQSAATLEPGERDAQIARIDMLTDIIEVALAEGSPDTRPALAPGVDGDAVEAAYTMIFDQLFVLADRSDAEARQEIINLGCALASAEDAPGPGVVPGPGE